MSRIIVKNLPKTITEIKLKEHFSLKGEITDVKIMRKESGASRNFGFIGFKNEETAKECIKYFNDTYLFTSRIRVEEAKVQGDPSLSRFKNQNKKPKHDEIEGNDEEVKLNKESKIKKILELAKEMSVKSKFDAYEKKIKEEKDKEKEKETNTSTENPKEETKVEQPMDVQKPNEENLDPKRLYLRNLPFHITEEDLKNSFSKYGSISEVHIPIKPNTNESFGYAYIAYETVESAVMALSEMDGVYFQGRRLHITPAKTKQTKVKPDYQNYDLSNGKSSYKAQKQSKLRENYSDETSWNYLFMNQNAVIETIAKRHNIDKSEILSKDNADLAVQIAAMETAIINETKEWLMSQGINLDALKGKRMDSVRNKNTILIKNISSNAKQEDLEKLFSRYGNLVRFLMSPSNTLGIAEYVDSKHAINCIKKLAYYEVDGLPLYLEFAPEGLVKDIKDPNKDNVPNKEGNEDEINLKEGEGKILFCSNINFCTKESSLKKLFTKTGLNVTKVKIVTHKKDGKEVSSGFGFVEFPTEEMLKNAMKALQGHILDGHSLKLSLAKTSNATENKKLLNRKRESEFNDYDYEGEEVTSNKLLVKNLAFEANKEELRKLFKAFGEVKTVRIPKKLDGSHRGFAFIDFVSHEEARNAFKSLQNTHFYGRKLVIEWAQAEKTVEELRQDTERKVKAANIETHKKQRKGELHLNKLK